MTTTLISLSTPNPLKVIPCIIKAQDTMTMVASKRLKPSIRKAPLEANVFRIISVRKTVRKTKSIVSKSVVSSKKSSDMVRSKRMKIEYKPIVRSDKLSMY